LNARTTTRLSSLLAAATLLAAAPFLTAVPAGAQGGAAPAPPSAGAKVVHPIVTMVTTKGTIKMKLFPEDAPKTVENFVKLAKKGYYNGLKFHRVVPGFVIQGGDPKGDGTGGPGYTIPDETNKILKHNRGAVAMAKSSAPNSAGSQFYIVIDQPAHQLDSGYTVFGTVIQGQDVAEKIQVGDKMTKVTVAP
jgi:cyclophilin family peptidyl-prolyl cis-trans isomerase